MERNKRAVRDPSDVNSAKDGDQEHASATGNPVHHADAPGSVESEDRGASKNTIAIATHFEFGSASSAGATPPSASRGARPRGRKQVAPTKFIAESGDPVPRDQGVSAAADGDQGDAPVDDKKLKRACSAPGATVAIAHASPPDSYRRAPSRSRKQYSPKRFVAAAGASASPNVPAAGGLPPAGASPGSALMSASPSGLRLASDATASSGVIDASASSSSSKRPPSRGRKQPRPAHFIPEEAEASASAKARRSDTVLDRFLSSVVHGTPASDSEWVRNVTAEDAAVLNQRGGQGFRIRDASRHAARARAAISRLGASCGGPCSSALAPAPGSPAGEPDGKGRFYGVLAVLGASLALSVVSCVLFYIVGQRSDSGPSAEKQDK